MDLTLVVLAAGIGSRYGGIKQMDPMGPGGEFIIDYSVYDALKSGFNRVVFVISRAIEADFKKIVGARIEPHVCTRYVLQDLSDVPSWFVVPPERKKPWGTGHAVMMAEREIGGPFGVINSDDFYGKEAYEVLANFLCSCSNDGSEYAMIGYRLRNTLSDHGNVCRGVCSVDADGRLMKVVEKTRIRKTADGAECPREDGGVELLSGDEIVSMNMWGFTSGLFPFLRLYFERFLRESGNDSTAEFFLPTVVDSLVSAGHAAVKVLSSNANWFGVTYPQDRQTAVEAIRRLIAEGEYPVRLWS